VRFGESDALLIEGSRELEVVRIRLMLRGDDVTSSLSNHPICLLWKSKRLRCDAHERCICRTILRYPSSKEMSCKFP
jgi:hypothetical protein